MSGLSQYCLIPNCIDKSWTLWCRQESDYNTLINMTKSEQYNFIKKYYKLQIRSANLIIKQKEIQIGEEYKCTACNYATNRKGDLNKHNQTLKHLKHT
jgi:hypothetical protein